MNYRLAIGALTLSAAGLVGLVTSEGYTDRAVIPVKGDVPTIGFGTTSGVKIGDTTDPVRALTRAARDVTEFEGAVKVCVKTELYQNEYDAYVKLAYNIGRKAFCGSTLVAKLNRHDYAGACAEISRWDKFKGKPLKGLTKRRAEERDLCERQQ